MGIAHNANDTTYCFYSTFSLLNVQADRGLDFIPLRHIHKREKTKPKM